MEHGQGRGPKRHGSSRFFLLGSCPLKGRPMKIVRELSQIWRRRMSPSEGVLCSQVDPSGRSLMKKCPQTQEGSSIGLPPCESSLFISSASEAVAQIKYSWRRLDLFIVNSHCMRRTIACISFCLSSKACSLFPLASNCV